MDRPTLSRYQKVRSETYDDTSDERSKTAPRDNVVAVVEDHEGERARLSLQLTKTGFQIHTYPSAESFLEACGSLNFDCLIADTCLPKMDGLALLEQVRRATPFVSVILIAGEGTMSQAVRAMKAGALDCLQKPISEDLLLSAVRRGADTSRALLTQYLWLLDLKKREATLTRREHEVFVLTTIGLLNKQVAARLGAAERTIKAHRGRVMKKMDADSLAELVRMADILQIHVRANVAIPLGRRHIQNAYWAKPEGVAPCA